MALTAQDLELPRGNSLDLPLAFLQENGIDPVDLSAVGIKVWFTMRTRPANAIDDADPPVLQKTLAGGGIVFVTNGINGQAKIVLAPTDTAALPQNSYFYDVQLKATDGKITTTQRGRISFGWRTTGAVT
jgi:hypothetical protein